MTNPGEPIGNSETTGSNLPQGHREDFAVSQFYFLIDRGRVERMFKPLPADNQKVIEATERLKDGLPLLERGLARDRSYDDSISGLLTLGDVKYPFYEDKFL